MARAVVLYFEDNNEADEYIKYHRETIDFGGHIELVVAVPTQFCEGGHKKGKFSMAYTRGLKWGWWVCVHCKKPSGVGGFMKTLRACLSQGKQLLPDGNEDVAAVTDEGWGALNRG